MQKPETLLPYQAPSTQAVEWKGDGCILYGSYTGETFDNPVLYLEDAFFFAAF